MKAKVKATELKRAIAAVLALQKLNESKAKSKKKDDATAPEGLKGRLTAHDGKLQIESVNMGAYVSVMVSATLMRPGTVGVDLTGLEKLRLSGTAVVGLNEKTRKLKIKAGRSDYELALDQDAEALVDALVPEQNGVNFIAKVPTSVLSLAASTVAIKPGIKTETMRMQFRFDRTNEGNFMEVTGVDFFSYGRFLRRGAEVQLRGPTKFVLRAASLSSILKHVSGSEMMIGVQTIAGDDETASVRFQSDDVDIMYPTLDMPFQDPEEVYRDVTAGTCDAGFTATRKNIREAINTVKVVAEGNKPLMLNIQVAPKQVTMGALVNGNTAFASIAAKDIRLSGADPHIMRLNQNYFNEIISLAPEVVPMRVESWNQAQTIVRGEKVENGRIEYTLSQVDSTDLVAEADD
jgi:hypothetical protein